ncbi:MAG: 6-carboxytetrahydropterin synthase QueD [Candidatus Heimdallarchaeaceae archaeon]
MKLRTEAEFDAAHHLVGYDGPCSRVHGHRWKVVVEVEGRKHQLNKVGILWDFTNLKEIVKELDHQDLNKILEFNPTAENLCCYILARLKEDRPDLNFRVRVYESPKSSCEVEE